MELHSDGNRLPTKEERDGLKRKQVMRRALNTTAIITDAPYESRFRAETPDEADRALSLHLKEPGTMAWLDATLRPGDRFLDIGANVGIYAISAAHRVGERGCVYAAEPHMANIPALIDNIRLNGFDDLIRIVTAPLTDRPGPGHFNYRVTTTASSGSQFGATRIPGKAEFMPQVREITMGVSVDYLISEGMIDPPHVVKIDVDGIEQKILTGMAELLSGPDRPKSVQVELNRGEQDAIITLMDRHRYRLDHRHATIEGQRKIDEGGDIMDHPHNAVFVSLDV